jgi:hypothetical protein
MIMKTKPEEFRNRNIKLDFDYPTEYVQHFQTTDIPGEIKDIASGETFIPDPDNKGVWIAKPKELI